MINLFGAGIKNRGLQLYKMNITLRSLEHFIDEKISLESSKVFRIGSLLSSISKRKTTSNPIPIIDVINDDVTSIIRKEQFDWLQI